MLITLLLAMAVLANDCSIQHNGKQFDISSLQKSSDNYVIQSPDGTTMAGTDHMQFYMNVCKDLNQKKYDQADLTSAVTDGYAMVAYNPATTSFFKLGRSTKIKMQVVADQAYLNYYEGSMCDSKDGAEMSASIRMICDSNEGQPAYVYDDGCSFMFEWRTRAACSSKATAPSGDGSQPSNSNGGGMSGAGIFFLILFILAIIYLVFGIYRRRSQGVRGLSQIPHFDQVVSWIGSRRSQSRYQSVSVADQGNNSLMSDTEQEV